MPMRKYDLQKKYRALASEKTALEKELALFPRGSIRRKNIKGREYPYLQFREGTHIRSKYIRKDELDDLVTALEKRDSVKARLRAIRNTLAQYEKLLGLHTEYVPEGDVDYNDYTLFMSAVAHDYKRLSFNEFIEKYDISKLRGVNKRYLKGFIDHVTGVSRVGYRKSNKLVLDPYTWLMYTAYGEKDVIREELQKAIPAFLNYGLLITNIQEAVHGT